MNWFPTRARTAFAALAFSLLCGALLSIGCGGGSSSQSETAGGDADTPRVTDPLASPNGSPSPPSSASNASSAFDASAGDENASSSGLVLPPGEIPLEPKNDEEPSPGLQMPPLGGSPADSSDVSSTTEVRFATWDAVEQTVASDGRITVVDFWSLACPPCLHEFPGLVRLHREFGDRVRCVGFDLDYDGRQSRPPEFYRPQVAAFLVSVEADFENYISQTPIDDVLAEVGVVSIPAVLIYDADGKLIKRFADSGETAGFTYDNDIIPLIRQLAG